MKNSNWQELLRNLANAALDALRNHNKKEQEERNLLEQTRMMQAKHQQQVCLQNELYMLLYQIPTPNYLQPINKKLDIAIVDFNIDQAGQTKFTFRWKKVLTHTHPFLPDTLLEIQDELNRNVGSLREELSYFYRSMTGVPLLNEYPHTLQGFTIVCSNDDDKSNSYLRLTVII